MHSAIQKNNKFWLWIIFLVYPLGAFIYAVRNFNVVNYRKFILLFGVFYGFTYIPIENSDSTRYNQRITEMKNYSFKNYLYDITHMYDSDSETVDAYVITVFFIVSKFTNEPTVYRAVFALVFFLVQLKLISVLYDYIRKKNGGKPMYAFLIGVLFLINLSSGINGVRFGLAVQIFTLGLFLFITRNDKRYLLYAIMAFFVHFMIGYLLFFLLLYLLTKKIYNSTYALIIISVFFLFSLNSGTSIKEATGLLGEGIDKKATSYIENENYKQQRNEHLVSLNWYVQFDRYSTYYFGFFCLFLIVIFKDTLHKDQTAIRLEYFSLLMYFSSFVSGQLVDEISNRYYLFANAFFLIYMLYLSSTNDSKLIQNLQIIYIPILILHCLIVLRGDLYTVSPNLVLGNLITEKIYSYEISIQDLIFK